MTAEKLALCVRTGILVVEFIAINKTSFQLAVKFGHAKMKS